MNPAKKKSYNKVGFKFKLLTKFIMDVFLSIMLPKNKMFLELLFRFYCIKKYSTLYQKKLGMSIQDEIKRHKEKIQVLVFAKGFQQNIIADIEIITGVDMFYTVKIF